MKNTILINLFGAPGTGKSTICAETFAKLKWLNIDSEMAPEYAKEIVWEKNFDKLASKVYILGKQYHRIRRLYGKVSVIITDCPLLNFMLFNTDVNSQNLIRDFHNHFDSINIFLTRTKPYNPNGRTQTEEQSDELSNVLREILHREMTLNKNGKFYTLPAVQNEASDKIVEILMNKLKIGDGGLCR